MASVESMEPNIVRLQRDRKIKLALALIVLIGAAIAGLLLVQFSGPYPTPPYGY